MQRAVVGRNDDTPDSTSGLDRSRAGVTARASFLRRVRPGRQTLREDATAGVVLGVLSVPDGLAAGLLAAVNPVYGLYAYMIGTVTGALFTSSVFMAVQATGAMAIIIADVGAVHGAEDPGRALFTLSVVTGAVMVAAGVLGLGSVLRFVSRAVLVGFISAVGVNIVLGQLAAFTGYDGMGANRVARAIDTVIHISDAHFPTLAIGVGTVALIVMLERTRLGPLGMVLAILATSAAVGLFELGGVERLADVADVPNALPGPVLPDVRLVPALIVPALSLAFVGLVQGAAISAGFPNPDGRYPNPSRDFVGQGAANLAAGLFQAMPVGGSMSATALVTSAGARSRQAHLIAGAVMAITIVLFADAVELVAMPALAALLMLIGYRTVKPAEVVSVWKAGRMQAAVLGVTFVLTMLIPLQYAVLVGVGISIILYVVQQSNRLTIHRWTYLDTGEVVEGEPPRELPAGEVVVLQPYGSLFFASATVLEAQLPVVTARSLNSVVILRLRGVSDMGTTVIEVLRRYASSLAGMRGKLVLVSANPRIRAQLELTGVADLIGRENLYEGNERLGGAVRRAYQDATAWIENVDVPERGEG
jgi:sulfate permease, SulP family